jgi:S-adenosylmethionine-dependent methyltransferase
MKPDVKSESHFENDPSRYAAYLETPDGRLRADLTFANLQEFLPASAGVNSLCALDLGCGTGAAAVRLARLGIQPTLLDSSATMLALTERKIVEAGVSDMATVKRGDAAQLSNIFQPESFDIILCHNLLEYVDDPGAVLRGAVRVMRDSSAILSVLVRNQAGEVLKTALQTGDLAAAEHNLTAEWGTRITIRWQSTFVHVGDARSDSERRVTHNQRSEGSTRCRGLPSDTDFSIDRV